jgi:hypothetical protein
MYTCELANGEIQQIESGLTANSSHQACDPAAVVQKDISLKIMYNPNNYLQNTSY